MRVVWSLMVLFVATAATSIEADDAGNLIAAVPEGNKVDNRTFLLQDSALMLPIYTLTFRLLCDAMCYTIQVLIQEGSNEPVDLVNEAKRAQVIIKTYVARQTLHLLYIQCVLETC